ncbi:MAG: hypothetical protein BWY80_01376 [Firmicutes bacterium ADurb.Bin456]|nr:MAG: hypothetical protein BWY80_01376 [Firmicutes bacterium ADurb.Bin456]
MQCRDDLKLFRTPGEFGVFAGKFDSSLVGFGAAVAEKGFIQGRVFRQEPGQPGLLLDIIEVGAVDELTGLPANSFNHGRMAVTEGINRNAAHEVQVFPAIGVPKPGSLTLYRSQWDPSHIAHQILVTQFHDFLCIH